MNQPLDFLNLEQTIPSVTDKLFDFSYPFYNDSAADKQAFEEQFIWHYLTQEIGFETYGWWKVRLKSLLIDIMPKYARLWEISQKEYDMFATTNMKRQKTTTDSGTNKKTNTETRTSTENGETSQTANESDTNAVTSSENDTNKRTSNGTSNNTSNSNGDNKDAYSNTPQGGLVGVDNNTYLTDYRRITDERDSTSKTTDETTENVTATKERTDNATNTKERTDKGTSTNERSDNGTITENGEYGNNGEETETWSGKESGEAYIDIIVKERENVLNLNKMLIDDCACLFMGVF